MISDEYEQNPYQLNIKKSVNKKKIIISVLIVISIICIILIVNNITKTIEGYKVYEQYEAQLNSIKYQQEQKQAELEKKRQEKIPKLTDERKKEYGKYL